VRTDLEPAAGQRAGERGAILLIVLILSVTISLLSMALVSTAEVALRADSNASDLERAERGARSGVEWGAAAAKEYGIIAFTRTVVLDSGVEVVRQTRATNGPRLLGTGSSNGVKITVGADLQTLEVTRPYGFMSFSGTNKVSDVWTMDGLAYLGASSAPLNAGKAVQMGGDLDLVTSTALPAGQVVHTAGATNYRVGALTRPAWDTAPFSVPGNWTVPYSSYSGSQTIRDVTLNGLVVVTLAAGQTLRLENVILNGTLVVPWLYPPTLDLLGTPTIELKGTTRIIGGTAQTGNLAILAPGCQVTTSGGGLALTISGVCYVREVKDPKSVQLNGQLLVRLSIASTNGDFTFRRPADFLPDVPVGFDWGGNKMMIRWLGRQ